jgi:hypothetical protein
MWFEYRMTWIAHNIDNDMPIHTIHSTRAKNDKQRNYSRHRSCDFILYIYNCLTFNLVPCMECFIPFLYHVSNVLRIRSSKVRSRQIVHVSEVIQQISTVQTNTIYNGTLSAGDPTMYGYSTRIHISIDHTSNRSHKKSNNYKVQQRQEHHVLSS